MDNISDRDRLIQYLRQKAEQQNTEAADLEAVQQDTANKQAMVGMLEGGSTITNAAFGLKNDPNAYATAKTANQQMLTDYLNKKKAERNLEWDKFQAVKELADLEEASQRQKVQEARIAKEMAMLNKPQLRVDPNTGKLAKFVQGNFAGWATKADESGAFFDSLDPNKKRIYKSVESDTAKDPVVQTAASSLATIQQIEPKLAAAEAGDTGQLASAVNNAARAIGGEKGVMTDRDVLRASGLPEEWYGKTSDQILTQIGALDETRRIQTLKNMVNASKLMYNKQLQGINANALAKARAKGVDVPEGTNFLPVSVSPISIAPTVSPMATPSQGPSIDQRRKSLEEKKAKLKELETQSNTK